MTVAQRILKIDIEGDEVEVPIRIHVPIQRDDHWQCDYEIGWPTAVRRSVGRGIDSVQSLLIAMQKIGAEIYTIEAHRTGKLKWERHGGGYGFPLPRGIRDLHEGDDKSM